MPAIGPAQPVNYYEALALNPNAPASELLPALNQRAALSPPGPERAYAEQARAILGDSGKKRVYDQRLHNPAAKPWSPQELHELAISQPTGSSAVGLLAQIKTAPTRILTAVAGLLLIILVVIVTAVSCTGGSTDVADSSTANEPSSESGDQSADPYTNCVVVDNGSAKHAKWTKSRAPGTQIVLSKQIPLPSELHILSGQDVNGNKFIRQYQDKNVAVSVTRFGGGAGDQQGEATWVATYTPDGKLVSNKTYADADEQPKSFDLMRDAFYGYVRLVANKGIDIPAAAAGDEDDKKYALTVLPDAFDDDTVWVLLRGGTSLYKGSAVLTNDSEQNCAK